MIPGLIKTVSIPYGLYAVKKKGPISVYNDGHNIIIEYEYSYGCDKWTREFITKSRGVKNENN